MYSQALLVLAAAALSKAATPKGFEPASETELIVTYGNLAALNGADEPKASVQVQPTLSTSTKLEGEYAVIMIDLDIPTNNPPETSTLLHWMQTGLTSTEAATTLNITTNAKGGSAAGSTTTRAFLLQNRGNASALAPYIGPSPPARVPLSHRYTQILVNHTGASAEAVGVLQRAAASRQGFNATLVLGQAGLLDRVVAGNFFTVTNAGPATGFSNGTTGTGSGTGSGRGSASGTGTAGAPKPTATFKGAAAAALAPSVGVVGLWVGLVAAVFLGL